MNPTKVLLLCGGGGAEHEVSLISADYIESELNKLQSVSVIRVELTKCSGWTDTYGRSCRLNLNKTLDVGDNIIAIDYVVPCIHGFPGETGDIQSLLKLSGLPFMGCDASASILCFNKITSKLWFDAIGIPNTPYVFLTENNNDNMVRVEAALESWGTIFIKAACQGSSIGCYKVTDKEAIQEAVENAFTFSKQVLVEKNVIPRELEIAVYHYDGNVVVTNPGEISWSEGTFYTYEEKYSARSHSSTSVKPENLTDKQITLMRKYAKKAFVHLKLKDLSRIDFFLTEDGEVLLNEINTFPGMTPISMFPKLVEHNELTFVDFLGSCIYQSVRTC
ncbi:D-alanine--D-alanine ligase [Candidatus Enterovibrio escicola]|uniref:D-alanine--D-alanine ligase n=1 Tax=Candidatus Enterovibrio escicola TaxID=1927127 RepID=A0A2A5T0W0_9GAMM|nr:D-alanine--D-alanine ligase [Candidatus Enterovibrio escacola]PCS21760.1 D-alanine--D-alanine ligase [Candidatus Enterovibrio escacola]